MVFTKFKLIGLFFILTGEYEVAAWSFTTTATALMNEAVGIGPFGKNMGPPDRSHRPKYVKFAAILKGRSTTIQKIALGLTKEPAIACVEYAIAKNCTDALPARTTGRLFARMSVGVALAEKRRSQRSKQN